MFEGGIFFFYKIHSFISHSLFYISSKLLPNVRTKSLEGKKTWLGIEPETSVSVARNSDH